MVAAKPFIYIQDLWIVATAEHSRHKTIFCAAYVLHEVLKGVSPESAGQFYLIIEVLHSLAG